MPGRKMRVEMFDSEGNKYTLSFEGQITREKALRILDLAELLGGVTNEGNPTTNRMVTDNGFSKYDKVRVIIQRHFPLVWFSSREIQSVYEREYEEPISLSTVATYFSRMADRGVLVKTGASNHLKYRVAPSVPQVAPNREMP